MPTAILLLKWLLRIFPVVVGIFFCAGLAQAATTATAALSANGSTDQVNLSVGDTLTLTWDSAHGNSPSSRYMADSSACGQNGTGPFDYSITTLSGSQSSAISSCQAGHTFRIYFEVKSHSGVKVTSMVKIVVAAEEESASTHSSTNTSTQAAASGVGSLIEAVQLDSDVTKAQSIQFGNRVNTDSQEGALDASADTLKQAANHNATLGALYCAQGANQAAQNPELAETSLKNCQDQFNSAIEMQSMEQKLGAPTVLTPDKDVLAKSGSQTTLGEFEANFGISGEDFMQRMLANGGSTEELKSMVSPKLDSAKFDAALAAANTSLAHDKDLISDPDKKLAKQNAYSLRDKVRAKVLQEITSRSPASTRTPASPSRASQFLFQPAPKDQFGHLEPMENAFAALEDSGELTLFEVIHQKYSEVSVRMHR